MSTNFTPLPERINQKASEWFALLQSDHVTDKQQQQFDEWMAESDNHLEAYRQISEVWVDLEILSSTCEAQKLKHSVSHREIRNNPFNALLESAYTWMQSHRVAATSFATVSLLVIYLVTMVPNFTAAPAAETRYVSAIGEIRTVILEDLSSIDLGANSEIKVQFSDSSRQIELIRGEAFFEVTADPDRPFVVNADLLSVQVVGTQFDVRKRYKGVSVSVLEGIVNVIDAEESTQPDTALVRLTAGQRVVKSLDHSISNIQAVAEGELGAWRTGRLIYRNANLIDVLSDASRYYEGSIELGDMDLSREKITITLRSDQISMLPVMLSEALPVQATQFPGNRIVINRSASKQ